MLQTTNDTPSTDIIVLDWLLLDTCSTISSVKIKDFVQKIQACGSGKELWAYTNSGHQDYSYTVTMELLPSEVFKNKTPFQKF